MIALTGLEEMDVRALAAACEYNPPLVNIVREAVREYVAARLADGNHAFAARFWQRRRQLGNEYRERYEQRIAARRRGHLSLVTSVGENTA